MSLDNLVIDISISLGSPPVSRQGFGTPMILAQGLGVGFTERIRFYSSAAEAAADADLSADAIARLTTGFAQSPAPTQIAVGRREADVAQVIDFTVTGATDGDYSITINGLTHTFTASGSTVSLIVAGLVSLINTGVDLGALTLTFNDNGTSNHTIVRSAGSWLADGVGEGMDVTITGSVSNNSTFTVESVTATTLTLVPTESLTQEGPVAVATCVVQVPVTAVDNDPVVEVTADNAGDSFTYSSASTGDDITEAVSTANVGVADELAAVLAANSDWFGFVLDNRSDTDILRAARDFAEANKRLFIGQSDSADMITSAITDIASDLQRRSLQWTHVKYYSDDTENCDIAHLAGFLANDFDQVAPTASFNTLETIPFEELGTTAQNNLVAKNAGFYTTLKGIGATSISQVAAGFELEHVVTAAWAEARMSENIAQLFLNVSNSGSRIQYNDQGFQQVAAVVNEVLIRGEEIGHFNVDTSELDVPLRSEVTSSDEANGILRMSFGTQYSGLVKRVVLTGTVSTDFETLG